jgi:hypothetical protein
MRELETFLFRAVEEDLDRAGKRIAVVVGLGRHLALPSPSKSKDHDRRIPDALLDRPTQVFAPHEGARFAIVSFYLEGAGALCTVHR